MLTLQTIIIRQYNELNQGSILLRVLRGIQMNKINDKSKTKLVLFFLMTLGFTWLFWVPDGLGKRGLLPDVLWTNLGFFGAFGPLVVSFLLTWIENGKEGVKKLFRRGIDFKLGKLWWIITVSIFPLLIGISFLISGFVDGKFPPSEAAALYRYLPFVFFSVMFTSGPVLEEFGWRGYAMPKLQAKFSPFITSLILGFIWAVWHFPQFLVPHEKTGMFYITPIWSFVLTVMAANMIYTWVYNHTRGSVFAAILLHTQMNLFFWIFPVLYTTTGYLWVLGLYILTALVIIFIDREMFFKKPTIDEAEI